ncbi:MAG TPA: cupin domain-containing protein [Candidatus Limnocylindria bacterium]|nr:cupin domain-containing protein [Candidatus Limnocylindria bacterium]
MERATEDDDRLRTRPSERFAGSEHLFDLNAEAEKLLREPGGARNGHRQITLFRRGGITLVLFVFEEDGYLVDHQADGYVTVQVITGEIRMTTDRGDHAMPQGSLLLLEPGIRHDVRAVSASRMLLTVRLDPAEDTRQS